MPPRRFLGAGGMLDVRAQLTRANRSLLDKIRVLDVSDTSDGYAGGTDKYMTVEDLTLTLAAKSTAQITNSTVTSSDITGLAIPIASGIAYMIHAELIFQSAATTTGLALNFTGPAVTFMSWSAKIQQAAAGTDQFFEGTVTGASAAMPTTKVTSASVIAATTNYRACVDGLVIASAAGTLQLQCSSEVAASQITIQQGAVMVLTNCG